MTLDQAKQILEVTFKREHRAYAVWQRAKTNPSKADFVKILKNPNYVSNLEHKAKSMFADCQHWENAIKNKSYKELNFDTPANGWNFKKYYGI